MSRQEQCSDRVVCRQCGHKGLIPTIVGNSGVSPFSASLQVLLAGHAGLPTAVDPMRADNPRRRAQLRPDISVPLAFPAPALDGRRVERELYGVVRASREAL